MDLPQLTQLIEGRLLFQNEACLVINKLPGESSEFPRIETAGGEKIFPVNRLDMPVSGCLLLARNPEAAAFLGKAFANSTASEHPRLVEKIYWAIIEKSPAADALAPCGELVHRLGVNKKTNKSFVIAPDTTGSLPSLDERQKELKKAVLRYRVIGQGERYLFLEIDLVTGRHHQIRAQLNALGLHIKGDLKYGARRSEMGGGIRLHARSLAFPNPMNFGETIRANALPPMMDSLWMTYDNFLLVK